MLSAKDYSQFAASMNAPIAARSIRRSLSDPSARFQMAGFFDPDAPARPIRIALPIDTSPAGLRKHDKNTAFMISDILCGQIGRFKKLSLGDLVLSVLPWPFHKPLDMSAPDQGPCVGGEICSLSIPIHHYLRADPADGHCYAYSISFSGGFHFS